MAGLIGVGYEGLSLRDLLDGLLERGVTVLVDVRLTPISRKTGFSKTALSRALEEAGIAYRHRPALGNPKDNRAGFSGDRLALAHAREVFARRMSRPQGVEAIEELAALAREAVVAVLCFEADQARCHRDVVLAEVSRVETALGLGMPPSGRRGTFDHGAGLVGVKAKRP